MRLLSGGVYRMIKTEILPLGEMQTNCCLVYDEKTKRGWITDPGAEALKVSARISSLEIKPEAILLTHGHFDHIMASDELRSLYHIPVYACREEEALLADPSANLSDMWAEPYTVKADRLIQDRQILEIAGYSVEVLHTPGHTKGSVCYYIESENILLSGDTLFYESFGRTDFPGGSFFEMRRSVHRLLQLPEKTIVYPGHGEETNIGHEKRYNPAAG